MLTAKTLTYKSPALNITRNHESLLKLATRRPVFNYSSSEVERDNEKLL